MKTEPKANPAIIHEYWRPQQGDKAAVKLRIKFKDRNRTWILKYPKMDDPDFSELYGQTILLTKNEFKKATGTKPGKFEVLNLQFAKIKTQARDVIKDMPVFTFDEFEKLFFSKPTDKEDLFAVLVSRAKELRAEGRISTAVSFECSLNSLKEYTGKDKFPFDQVTVKFLKDYEKWMLHHEIKVTKDKTKIIENSRTTVGIYLRNVRTAYNQVKPVGVLYPFGKSKQGLYSIPKGKNTKKALTQADVSKIANYQAAAGTIEQRSRDFWLFSYLCNGINIKDMARLRYANIKDDKITLIRAKTANTVEEEATIQIMITKQIGRIIDLWGNKTSDRAEYIFPILHKDMTAEDEYRAIQQTVQTTNKNMKRICQSLGIDKVTTYTARHSFATVLKRSGASIEFISESLGHRNKQTTQNYLANFEDEEKRKWANILLPEPD